MTDNDPIDRLADVRDVPEEPDAEFSARLLDDLLADLSAPGRNTTVPGAVIELERKPINMEKSTPTRTWTLRVLAAAAVAAAVVGGIVLAQRPDDPTEQPAQQPAEAVTTTTAPPSSATVPSPVEAVRDAIDAFNAGDIEAFAATMTFGDQTDRWIAEAMMNANARWTEVEPCQEVDQADLQVTEFVPWGPEHERFVHCVFAVSDDFFGPAGLDRDETFECGVAAEGRVTCVSRYLGDDPSLDEDALDAYIAAFWEWLGTAEPDTYATIQSSDGEIPGSQDDPDQMMIALSVLDDFLAQSDQYPQR